MSKKNSKTSGTFMTPLADPVVAYIYDSVEHAGLAAQSFIQAAVRKSGETFGKVIRVTPQKVESDALHRGYRIDVQAVSDDNQYANQEVQLKTDTVLHQRNFLGAIPIFQQHAKKGSDHREMAKSMPQVFAINILAYKLPNAGADYFQPVHFRYDYEPRNIAVPEFVILNIQLPRFPEAAVDFADPLYNWACMLYNMHKHEKTPQEVLKMETRLQTFYEQDEGLRQFCDRYGHAVETEEVREAYNRWYIGQMRDWGEMDGARQEGRNERNVAIAKKLLMRGLPVYDIAEDTGLSLAEVEQLRGNTH
jgi:hypothetical protein